MTPKSLKFVNRLTSPSAFRPRFDSAHLKDCERTAFGKSDSVSLWQLGDVCRDTPSFIAGEHPSPLALLGI